MKLFLTLLLTTCCLLQGTVLSAEIYPVAVFHGMGDACANAGMARFTQSLSDQLGGVYSVCIESGAGFVSIGTDLEGQLERACELVKRDPKLAGKDISVVGLS